MKKPHFIAFSCLIGAWVAWLLSQIGGIHFWFDEAITMIQLAGFGAIPGPNEIVKGVELNSQMDGNAPLLEMAVMLMYLDVHPPIYYWIAEIWTRIFGSEALAIRSLSLIATTGSIVLIALSPNKMNGWSKVFIAIVLMSSPPIIFAAANARDYGLALFFGACAIFFCHTIVTREANGDKGGAGRAFILACVFSGLAFLTHYFTAFLCAPLILCVLPIAWRAMRRSAIVGVFSGVIMSLAAAPFLQVQMTARPQQYAGFTEYSVELIHLLRKLVSQTTMSSGGSLASTYALYLTYALSAIAVGALLKRSIRDLHARMHFAVISSFALLVLTLFAATDKTLTEASPRYMLFALPSLAFAMGYLFQSAISWSMSRKVISKILILALFTSVSAPYVIGSVSLPMPFVSHANLEANRKNIEIAAENDGIVIIPISRWDSALFYQVLSDDIDVYQGISREALSLVFDEAEHRSHVMIMTPPSWDPNGARFVSDKINKLERCGFKHEGGRLWVRSGSSPCVE